MHAAVDAVAAPHHFSSSGVAEIILHERNIIRPFQAARLRLVGRLGLQHGVVARDVAVDVVEGANRVGRGDQHIVLAARRGEWGEAAVEAAGIEIDRGTMPGVLGDLRMEQRELRPGAPGNHQNVAQERQVDVLPAVAVDVFEPAAIVAKAGELVGVGKGGADPAKPGAAGRVGLGDVGRVEQAQEIPMREVQIALPRRQERIALAAGPASTAK